MKFLLRLAQAIIFPKIMDTLGFWIIGAVKKGKKVIAIPRLSKYGEHVDDHQLQLLHQFDDLGIICSCYDVERLDECFREVADKEYKPYVSNTKAIIDSIEEFLELIEKKRK